jgi:ppGpp synthetase/RelA/SpoT-type nucleotidyltranferase
MNDHEGPALSRAEISNLESALLEYKQAMLDQDIHPDNFRVVITSDLRAAVGEQEWPLFLRRMEEKLGKIIDVLEPLEEAAYLYASTLRTAPGVALRRAGLVVEVGEEAIRLVFGKGPRKIEETLTAKGLLPFGTQALSLEDAFGPIDVALARETARAALRDGLSQELTDAAKGRNVYLAGDAVLDLLFALEAERPVSEANPITNGLDATIMDWYLSPEGLEHLQQVEQEGRYTESLGPNAISMLIERLIFLRELPAALGFERYRFGSGGGEQAGLLDEMVRTEVSRRMERYGRALHKRYRREYPEAQRILGEIFPDVRVRGRAKDAASIADKLNRKAMRTGPQKQVIQDIDDAGRLIGDGHGLRLVLETTRRDRIETIREQLITAIRNGVVQILEINNCHAGGPDALPYFTEEDIIRIRMAAETTRQALPTEDRPPVVKVLDGPGAIKPSGYTTTQLNIRLRNPETGHFDLICELQIRGIEVERFSAAEHLIHDFRRGKDPYKKNPRIREHFEPEVAPLLKAIQEMREAEFRKFTDYLSRFYLHCRRLESGYTVPEPELPVDLPAVCHVNNIKRLSRLQRELIARFKRPARKPPAANPSPVKPEAAR